jgi:cytochrome b involved in lipid metabolism
MPEEKKLDFGEVAKHNTADDTWMVIKGKVRILDACSNS